MNTKITLAALAATVGLVGCQKAAEQVKNEAEKKSVQAEMAGNWFLECKGSDLLNAGSERTKYDFAVNGSKTIQLYKDGGCRDAVGEIKYTGPVEIGNETQNVPGARLLKLDYKKVTVTVKDQATVDALNGWLPSCGVNDLKVNEEREITAQTKGENVEKTKLNDKKQEEKGAVQKTVEGVADAIKEGVQSATCPVPQPKPVYDIVKLQDGQIHFGKASATQDKSAEDKRPTELDQDPKSVLKRD